MCEPISDGLISRIAPRLPANDLQHVCCDVLGLSLSQYEAACFTDIKIADTIRQCLSLAMRRNHITTIWKLKVSLQEASKKNLITLDVMQCIDPWLNSKKEISLEHACREIVKFISPNKIESLFSGHYGLTLQEIEQRYPRQIDHSTVCVHLLCLWRSMNKGENSAQHLMQTIQQKTTNRNTAMSHLTSAEQQATANTEQSFTVIGTSNAPSNLLASLDRDEEISLHAEGRSTLEKHSISDEELNIAEKHASQTTLMSEGLESEVMTEAEKHTSETEKSSLERLQIPVLVAEASKGLASMKIMAAEPNTHTGQQERNVYDSSHRSCLVNYEITEHEDEEWVKAIEHEIRDAALSEDSDAKDTREMSYDKSVDVFRLNLMERYREDYHTLNPLPWVSTIEASVLNDVFITLYAEDEEGNKSDISMNDLLIQECKGSWDLAKRILLHGEAGSGKTTLTAKIALDWANRQTDIENLLQFTAVLIVKASFIEECDTLNSYIDRECLPNVSDFLNVEKDLCYANILIVIDGYDEKVSRKDFIGRLLMRKIMFNSTIVLTSRYGATQSIRHDFDLKAGLQGLSQDDITVFVQKYADEETKRNILEMYATNHPFVETLAIPLYLWIFVLLGDEYFKDIQQFTRTEFYTQTLEGISDKAKHKLCIIGGYEEKEIDNAVNNLCTLAHLCMRTDILHITEVSSVDNVSAKLGLLNAIVSRSGIKDKKMFVFAHKAIMEFLTAKHIISVNTSGFTGSANKRVVEDLLTLPEVGDEGRRRASMVMLFVLGLLKEEQAVVTEILETLVPRVDSKDTSHKGHLGLSCLSELEGTQWISTALLDGRINTELELDSQCTPYCMRGLEKYSQIRTLEHVDFTDFTNPAVSPISTQSCRVQCEAYILLSVTAQLNKSTLTELQISNVTLKEADLSNMMRDVAMCEELDVMILRNVTFVGNVNNVCPPAKYIHTKTFQLENLSPAILIPFLTENVAQRNTCDVIIELSDDTLTSEELDGVLHAISLCDELTRVELVNVSTETGKHLQSAQNCITEHLLKIQKLHISGNTSGFIVVLFLVLYWEKTEAVDLADVILSHDEADIIATHVNSRSSAMTSLQLRWLGEHITSLLLAALCTTQCVNTLHELHVFCDSDSDCIAVGEFVSKCSKLKVFTWRTRMVQSSRNNMREFLDALKLMWRMITINATGLHTVGVQDTESYDEQEYWDDELDESPSKEPDEDASDELRTVCVTEESAGDGGMWKNCKRSVRWSNYCSGDQSTKQCSNDVDDQSTVRDKQSDDQSTVRDEQSDDQSTVRDKQSEDQSTVQDAVPEEQSTVRDVVPDDQSTDRNDQFDDQLTGTNDQSDDQSTDRDEQSDDQSNSQHYNEDDFVFMSVIKELTDERAAIKWSVIHLIEAHHRSPITDEQCQRVYKLLPSVTEVWKGRDASWPKQGLELTKVAKARKTRCVIV